MSDASDVALLDFAIAQAQRELKTAQDSLYKAALDKVALDKRRKALEKEAEEIEERGRKWCAMEEHTARRLAALQVKWAEAASAASK